MGQQKTPIIKTSTWAINIFWANELSTFQIKMLKKKAIVEICAWHQSDLDKNLKNHWVKNLSHWICQSCFEIMDKDIANLRQ